MTEPAARIYPDKLSALVSWLTAGAPPQTDYGATVAELCRRLCDAGIGVDLFAVYHIVVNPLARGKMATWTPRRGARQTDFTHEEMWTGIYQGSVSNAVNDSRRMVRYRIGRDPRFDDHRGSAKLIAGGFTEYVGFPLIAVHEPNPHFGVATRRAGGFEDAEIAALRRVAAPLARVVEAEVQRDKTRTLLETYLGADAARKVLGGQIRRGDAEMTPAVILFADLAGFTALSNARPPEEVVATLNRFFEALEGPIERSGGVVLKLIGDGLLAIFPTPDDLTAEEGAALGALSALDDARRALAGTGIGFRASLHVGDIHYGNIGGARRLDFTAIGPAVNLAARMLEAAGADATVCSEEFAALVPGRARLIRAFEFKGFGAPAPVHAIV